MNDERVKQLIEEFERAVTDLAWIGRRMSAQSNEIRMRYETAKQNLVNYMQETNNEQATDKR